MNRRKRRLIERDERPIFRGEPRRPGLSSGLSSNAGVFVTPTDRRPGRSRPDGLPPVLEPPEKDSAALLANCVAVLGSCSDVEIARLVDAMTRLFLAGQVGVRALRPGDLGPPGTIDEDKIPGLTFTNVIGTEGGLMVSKWPCVLVDPALRRRIERNLVRELAGVITCASRCVDHWNGHFDGPEETLEERMKESYQRASVYEAAFLLSLPSHGRPTGGVLTRWPSGWSSPGAGAFRLESRRPIP